eukprot:14094992-Heterocapsa_arctica.AAC.1
MEWLSKMGAVRMAKGEALELARAHSSTEGYHIRMVAVSKPMETVLAYAVYEEMGDKIYALALDICLQDTDTIWTSMRMKGILTRSILALGYLFQTGACDQLEGIMELVVWIEDNVKAPVTTTCAQNPKEEEMT